MLLHPVSPALQTVVPLYVVSRFNLLTLSTLSF